MTDSLSRWAGLSAFKTPIDCITPTAMLVGLKTTDRAQKLCRLKGRGHMNISHLYLRLMGMKRITQRAKLRAGECLKPWQADPLGHGKVGKYATAEDRCTEHNDRAILFTPIISGQQTKEGILYFYW